MSAFDKSQASSWRATVAEAPVTVRYKSSPAPSPSSFLYVSSLLTLAATEVRAHS